MIRQSSKQARKEPAQRLDSCEWGPIRAKSQPVRDVKARDDARNGTLSSTKITKATSLWERMWLITCPPVSTAAHANEYQHVYTDKHTHIRTRCRGGARATFRCTHEEVQAGFATETRQERRFSLTNCERFCAVTRILPRLYA